MISAGELLKGGALSLRFIRPVLAGNANVYKGKVAAKRPEDGRARIAIDVVRGKADR